MILDGLPRAERHRYELPKVSVTHPPSFTARDRCDIRREYRLLLDLGVRPVTARNVIVRMLLVGQSVGRR